MRSAEHDDRIARERAGVKGFLEDQQPVGTSLPPFFSVVCFVLSGGIRAVDVEVGDALLAEVPGVRP